MLGCLKHPQRMDNLKNNIMMNTRYFNPFLLFFVLLGVMASCGNASKEDQIEDLIDRADDAKTNSVYDDAYEYNQAIIGLQTEIGIQLIQAETIEEVEKAKKTILENTQVLEKLSYSGVDYGFKSSMFDLFSFYLRLTENEYLEIFDLVAEMEENPNDESFVRDRYNRIIEIQNNIDEEEMELSNAMLSSQEEFAAKNNFRLIDNPLDDEINAINEGQ